MYKCVAYERLSAIEIASRRAFDCDEIQTCHFLVVQTIQFVEWIVDNFVTCLGYSWSLKLNFAHMSWLSNTEKSNQKLFLPLKISTIPWHSMKFCLFYDVEKKHSNGAVSCVSTSRPTTQSQQCVELWNFRKSVILGDRIPLLGFRETA